MRKTKDIETALYRLLDNSGYHASAHSIPSSLGSSLPHVHVVRTGGFESDMVIETHYVDFDVYDAYPADAMTKASELCGWTRDLVGDDFYVATITTLPYENPDPRHPNIARVTFKASLICRTV